MNFKKFLNKNAILTLNNGHIFQGILFQYDQEDDSLYLKNDKDNNLLVILNASSNIVSLNFVFIQSKERPIQPGSVKAAPATKKIVKDPALRVRDSEETLEEAKVKALETSNDLKGKLKAYIENNSVDIKSASDYIAGKAYDNLSIFKKSK